MVALKTFMLICALGVAIFACYFLAMALKRHLQTRLAVGEVTEVVHRPGYDRHAVPPDMGDVILTYDDDGSKKQFKYPLAVPPFSGSAEVGFRGTLDITDSGNIHFVDPRAIWRNAGNGILVISSYLLIAGFVFIYL